MIRRVTLSGKVKGLRSGAEGKPSVNSAYQSCGVDPKASDLSMGRVKRLKQAVEARTGIG